MTQAAPPPASQAALRRAVEVAGGQKPLADKIGTSQSKVWYWLERAKKGVPAEWCAAIQRETGVSAHELRPDVFATSQDDAASQIDRHVHSEHGATHEVVS